jgi:hypothetical protein
MVPVPKILVGHKRGKDTFIEVFTLWRIVVDAPDCPPSNLVPVGDCGRRSERQLAGYSVSAVQDTVYALGIALVSLQQLERFLLLLELCVYVFDSDGGHRGRSSSGRGDGKAWQRAKASR